MKKKDIKLTKDTVDEYFSQWAIEAGEQIDKKAKKEGWDSFNHASAINFMLTDIREDVKKLIESLKS